MVNRSTLVSLCTALFVFVMLTFSAPSFAQVSVAVSFGPPALPVYEQPLCPGPGYIWTPGYWAYDNDFDDYYWVPGTWVLAPEPGFLWTPDYWGWGNGGYIFHQGYWGPTVGFYGGIDYGYGYNGAGYYGGRWEGDHFYYNRSVNNVNVTNIHNTYNTTVVNNTTVNRVSYNGGNGGTTARPTAAEEAAAHERHIAPVAAQTQHRDAARANPQQRASVNHGKPSIAATAKANEFSGKGVVAAKEAGAPYHPPANRGAKPGTTPTAERKAPAKNEAVHPNELPPHQRLAAPNTGNPKVDQKYQKQNEQLYNKQEKEHQQLQQKQDQEHQRLNQQHASEAQRQQVEQKHQQQTQQMEQRHAQEQQRLQQREQPRPAQNQPRPENGSKPPRQQP